MDLVVSGADGPTGRLVVRQALDVVAAHPRATVEVKTRSGLPSATSFLKEAFGG